MVSFTDLYNAISIDRLSSKVKLEKFHDILIILFNVSPSSHQIQRISCYYLFFLKIHSLPSDWGGGGRGGVRGGYTKFCFKENARTFSKNSPLKRKITMKLIQKRKF